MWRQARRRLLAINSADVYVELDGDSNNATEAIKEDLMNVVATGALAVSPAIAHHSVHGHGQHA